MFWAVIAASLIVAGGICLGEAGVLEPTVGVRMVVLGMLGFVQFCAIFWGDRL